MRTITIVNQSTVVKPADFAAAVAALQIQITRDFGPRWSIAAQLVAATVPPAAGVEAIYVLDNTSQADALGYHTRTATDVPIGYAFAETSIQAGDSWQATLSHEVLEQLIDPLVNLSSVGTWLGKAAAVSYEVADPVENDEYLINSVPVSNFIFPSWFIAGSPGPWDMLGKLTAPLAMSPGGYVAYTRNLASWQQTFGDKCPRHQRFIERFSRRHRRAKLWSFTDQYGGGHA